MFIRPTKRAVRAALGATALIALLAGCAGQAYSVDWAVAPTPLGARWLARTGAGILADTPARLHAALAALPCAAPGWPDEIEAISSGDTRTRGRAPAPPTRH